MNNVCEKIMMSMPPVTRKSSVGLKKLGMYNGAVSKKLGSYNKASSKKLGVYN